jgi:T5SS/PEP-CTERM-associated repeat protein
MFGRLRIVFRFLVCGFIANGTIFFGPNALAVTRTWTTFGSGLFNDANNWFPSGVPGPSDFVSFEVGFNPYTVTFPGNNLGDPLASYSTSFLRVRDNGVTFDGSTAAGRGASTYSVTSTTQTEANRAIIIGVGTGENSSLTVSHTGIVCCGQLSSLNTVAATLGDVANSSGTLNMNNGTFNVTGSDFTQTQLIVGNNGTGTLNVKNGADVNVSGFNSTTSLGHHAGSSGTVTVDGPGSTWTTADQLWIGEHGTGTFTVQNGGSVTTSSAAGDKTIIGVFADANGFATVAGAGSTWTQTDGLTVGNSGPGTLTVSNGGSLTTTGLSIGGGSGASGSVTVTGSGSTLNGGGSINVGSTGNASMAIQNGGAVTSGAALIRALNGGTAQVLLAGAGSSWSVTSGSLAIGLPEPGFTTSPTSLTINTGATVNVTHNVNLDTASTLTLQGGTLSAAEIGLNGLQFNGTFQWSSGTLHVGVFRKSLTNQAGTLAPGTSIGSTIIDGNYTQQAGAKLAIDIGGTAANTQYDVVSSEGVANLNGLLQLTLINAFMPTSGQQFTIFNTVGGITGAFSNVANGQRLTTSDGGGSFIVNYGVGSAFAPTSIVLSSFLAVGLPGDYNHNNVVDSADYVLWRNTLGQTGSGLAADGNGNGQVDAADFDIWRAHFGQTPGSGAAASENFAVPEPNPTTMLFLAAVCFYFRRC